MYKTDVEAEGTVQTESILPTVAVIGLGYVGLPVAVAFGKERRTIGYDLSKKRVENLKHRVDVTGEVSAAELAQARLWRPTTDATELGAADFLIVAVPTPINAARQPELAPLESASETVGRHMKPGAIVVYESTVYPGCTEEVCVPILERASGMRWRRDFHVGYSPERINPGDKEHAFPGILKVVAGDDESTLERIADLYGSVVQAGVYRAPSIRVAEAAKVIENTQRDLNIAFVNELAIIFERLGIDTQEVLRAAGTKWNFLPFRPGLVGGHCIGVDPYYLTHKAQQIGYHPEMILAGRRINDNMALYVADEVVRLMAAKRIHVNASRILVMGLAFKENTPDLRNSKVADLVAELVANGAKVDVWDPWVSAREAAREYGIRLVTKPTRGRYDAIVLAVPHREFAAMRPAEIRRFARRRHVVYDVKYLFERGQADGRL